HKIQNGRATPRQTRLPTELTSRVVHAHTGGAPRASYTRQVKECLTMLADLTDDSDHQAAEREAVLTVSVLVGAISMARAVDDPDLSEQLLANAVTALKQRMLDEIDPWVTPHSLPGWGRTTAAPPGSHGSRPPSLGDE